MWMILTHRRASRFGFIDSGWQMMISLIIRNQYVWSMCSGLGIAVVECRVLRSAVLFCLFAFLFQLALQLGNARAAGHLSIGEQ